MGGPEGDGSVAVVDVVVPVFNGHQVTRRCIESILATGAKTKARFELVVIDDASTDSELQRELDTWAVAGCLTLVRNDANRGFVYSANRGLGLHPERDVVLLNSDTEVAGDWLDRLTACAYRQSDIGTVTPFSNNATICSFPRPCCDNPLPEGLRIEDLDASFATANAGQYLEIPTGVGFCMYIRRDCLDAVGAFDEDAFGRGYGEENDLCRRALASGWRSVLCADVFVFHAGCASFGVERDKLIHNAEAVLRVRHPRYFDEVSAFIRQDPPARLRRAVEIELARGRRVQAPQIDAHSSGNAVTVASYRGWNTTGAMAGVRGDAVQLHIVHDLGGGIERWCKDYCRADTTRTNLILRPHCQGHAVGEGLMLFASPFDEEPLQFWSFARPYSAIASHHEEYARVIRDIVRDYQVDAVLVSSLIGHSLDALTAGPPTILIAHDYFPLCPAINLYYDGICQSCDGARIADCEKHNPDFNSFPLLPASERIDIRRSLLELIEQRALTMVVPSRIVWEHLESLFPSLSNASWVAIPHGTGGHLKPVQTSSAKGNHGKIKVVVLGVLSVNKGVRLLAEIVQAVTDFAEVVLVGAQELGEMFSGYPGVSVVPKYSVDELQSILERIRPDAGLLLSIWPETFSYTLSELMQAAVPPVATSVGAFCERVRDGETGFLVAPDAGAIVERLKALAAEPGLLDHVRRNLAQLQYQTAREMVADYHRLVGAVTDRRREPINQVEPAPADALIVRQASALGAMWKRVKSLDLQLSMSRECQAQTDASDRIAGVRQRLIDRQREVAEHQRAISEHQRTIAEAQRAIAEQQRALAETQLGLERREFQKQVAEVGSALNARDNLLVEKDAQLQELRLMLDAQNLRVHQVLTSTSWRLSVPIRIVGGAARRLRFIARNALPILREPKELRRRFGFLMAAWRTGGRGQVKQALLDIQAEITHQGAWGVFHRTFAKAIRPRIAEAVGRISAPPLISVIVPTYNTRLAMLEEMIASVRDQLYPCWELCIADDCSDDKGVREILTRHAAADRRIKVHLSNVNRGVSHASNCALGMAKGSFVVLLDHDDVLEEQALFRIAETILRDDPDMVYSDEVMVSENQDKVLQYAFRPAFSPEYLRSHPYIVHMVGFKAGLLRQLGGFDESLRISQDYDLILRASEQASRIVHIPEILYRWRIYGTSTGMQRMEDVTETSRGVLARHLARCGQAGEIRDGAGFNLFDTRYPLPDAARVAVIIPTKNHGQLVRQCIDSIHATVRRVDYDIVVVDHESSDPGTLDYLSRISKDVRVIRYSGPFNFSTINNAAVLQLERNYSHYLFCNNDIEAIGPDWLERMLELGQRPDVGIVGAQLLYPDRETIQHAGVCVGAFGAAEHFGKFIRVGDIPRYLGFSEILRSNHEVSAVTAACLLIRRDAYDAVGGFDQAFSVGFGDVDLCLRVGQAGYRIIQCAHAELLHHESFTRGKSRGVDPHPEDSTLFRSRWAHFLQEGDPYFNPALNLNSTAWLMTYPIPCHAELWRRVWVRSEPQDQSPPVANVSP